MTDNGTQTASWQSCVIEEIVQQTPSIKSFFLRLSRPFAHIAGQHVDVRLTAPDGYSAMRSYSIASSAASSPIIELAVERLPDGEVSAYFHDIAIVGDEIELRGPLGGHFLWPEPAVDAVLLIGAGSGLVPLMAMIRHRRTQDPAVPTALLLSARTAEDVLFSEELHSVEINDAAFVLALAITREDPIRASDFGRRIDSAMVEEVLARLHRKPTQIFVCGSNDFVNIATEGALLAGVDPSIIKTERYGG
ncbi:MULTISPECIES: ferredoxin reductase [Sphingopyxis]|jgi:ferredoxin-NADP reductase|uniref:ferredoxin reductase n=1 Tax=Sphingopyxis TaxID=165697 RepID=UPI0002D16C0B|nr:MULTISPECIES: ferredoxin reductase [Sphingopyxis]KTE78978.1 oxidoreductase [Sphingopyxis sp. A083]MBN8842109.1 ferredoxin reductase [Sphingomonadales bacterium]MCA0209360.1 ferredoxin reductase [Pseudomonadota bacterium]ENY81151.1 oxidoreductase FAD-binding region [Sphingopyxis sp. MC1]KTE25788.1 oxidoreductase [Sphingopyxis sp. H057]